MVVLIATLLSLIVVGWMTAAILTFLWRFVLVIAAVWTAARDLLIALCCFVVSLPSFFHFPSSSKKEKTHTLFDTHTHTHSLFFSLSKSLDHNSPETHCYPPNSPEIELDGDPNHLKPLPISSKRLSFYLALFHKWVCLKFQKSLFGSYGFVWFFSKKLIAGWIWFLKARVDGFCLASRVNFKITKYPRVEPRERERLRETFGRWSS